MKMKLVKNILTYGEWSTVSFVKGGEKRKNE